MDNNKIIKFEDQYLTLKNYKEPLKTIKKGQGFGFYGTILCTTDGLGIQCHVCGKIFTSLGQHILGKHKLNAKEYREKFQLSATTALISENHRQKLKQRMLDYLKSLTEKEKRIWKQKQIERTRNNKRTSFQPKISLETKNKRGTCPDQLLDKIKEIIKKLGHVPSLHEFVYECGTQRYKHLIFTTFGSWNNALKMLGIITKDRYEINLNNLKIQKRKYTDDQLLEYLVIYSQEHNKIPTATDFRRGLLPNNDIYKRRFGTIENARKLAGVYNFVSQKQIKEKQPRLYKRLYG